MGREDKEQKTAWWRPAVLLFAKMSVWIVAPVLLAMFIGKSLDKVNNTEPWMLLGCVGIAFIFSMIGLVTEATKEYKKIEQNEKKEDKNNNI